MGRLPSECSNLHPEQSVGLARSLVKLFTSIYQDCRLLPHFLRHYQSLGVNHYVICVHPQIADEVCSLTQSHEVVLHVTDFVAESVLADVSAMTMLRRKSQANQEWAIIVDLDEFLNPSTNIDSVINNAEHEGATVVRGIMHDRFSLSGKEHSLQEGDDLSCCFPIKSRFVRDVMLGADMKGVLVKGPLEPLDRASHHYFRGERVSRQVLDLSHFKWIHGALDRLRLAHHRAVENRVGWAHEYLRVIQHYERHGCFAWWTFSGGLASSYPVEEPQRCTICQAVIDDKEHTFSSVKYGRSLCRRHQVAQ